MWCMEKGHGSLVYVNGRYVLDSHPQCMTDAAVDQAEQCTCVTIVGDNTACPVHGVLSAAGKLQVIVRVPLVEFVKAMDCTTLEAIGLLSVCGVHVYFVPDDGYFFNIAINFGASCIVSSNVINWKEAGHAR